MFHHYIMTCIDTSQCGHHWFCKIKIAPLVKSHNGYWQQVWLRYRVEARSNPIYKPHISSHTLSLLYACLSINIDYTTPHVRVVLQNGQSLHESVESIGNIGRAKKLFFVAHPIVQKMSFSFQKNLAICII